MNNKEKLLLKVKYHADIEPLKITGDWIDLRVAEDVFIPEGQYKVVSLGISIQLPEGYEAHIVPRSSTFKNFGLIQANGVGIIDNGYCGDNDIWRFPAICKEGRNSFFTEEVAEYLDKDVVARGGIIKGTMLKKNDRICQMKVVEKMNPIEIVTVEKLGNKDRGGFGSTGIN